MANKTGTLDITSLLATRFQSAAAYGLNTIQQVLEADLAAHNAIMQDMVAGLCELTTDRQRIYGSSGGGGDMVEVDEYGRSATQKETHGSTAAFPLRLFQYAIGWTEKWFETHTPAEMAEQTISAENAHRRRTVGDIKRAIYLSANYTWTDFLVDRVALACKRFVNADSADIPDGPNGETFNGATHTHYTAAVALDPDDIRTNLINNVAEHGHSNRILIAIARADETAFRALSGFTAYTDPRLIAGTASDSPATRLDITRVDNRAIGIFDAAEVWVKPWAVANYAFAWDAGSPMKSLGFRQRNQATLQGMRVAATLSTFPLVAQYMEAEFGIAAWTRTNGAVHQFNAAVYADPTI